MLIRKMREKVGLTQNQLAKQAGITPAYLCGLETGKRSNPSIVVIQRLADALNVTVSDLLEQKVG